MDAAPHQTAADRTVEITGSGYRAEVVLSDLNQRIQVRHFDGPDLGAMVRELERAARREGYGKIFLKASAGDRELLERAGLTVEATIDGYLSGRPALVMSLFVDEARRRSSAVDQQAEILSSIRSRPADDSLAELPPGFSLTVATAVDAEELAALYNRVFASYPYPIHEPGYLVETMASHVVYRIVRDAGGDVVAAASAETQPPHRSAEMTDFATLPEQRGAGLAQHLLAALERDMSDRGIRDLYTIARARSAGMNRVFYNRGYQLTGTLVNNCHISGGFEDMHVWCKRV
jgi:putative beta-lysine N-acetyltransferase